MDFGRSFSSSPVITSYSSSLKTQWNMISIYYYILPGNRNRSWSTTHTKMRRTMLCPRTHKSNVHTVNPPTCWVIHEGKGEEVSNPCVGNKHDNKTERKKRTYTYQVSFRPNFVSSWACAAHLVMRTLSVFLTKGVNVFPLKCKKKTSNTRTVETSFGHFWW